MMNLALCYEFQMRYQMAIKWFNFAIQIDKDLHEAYLGLAISYFKDGDSKSACQAVEVGL